MNSLLDTIQQNVPFKVTSVTTEEAAVKTLRIAGTCFFCYHPHVISVPAMGFTKWIAGELIQKAMPDCDADTREFLLSGVCSECFNQMFE